jgi:hypothetical protein
MGTHNRKRVVVLSVVGLVAANLLYIDMSSTCAPSSPTYIVRNTQALATPVDALEKRGGSKLRIDLLATLQAVEVAGHRRDLFQFAAVVVKEIVKQRRPEPQIVPYTTKQPSPTPEMQQPTPIPFRFYGYTSMLKQRRNRAFFLEGEAIYIAAEGDIINGRYKVISVGLNSAVVEDTSTRSQQALPLIESM